MLMAESEEELKSLLMRVKGESEKADLKLNIRKTKILASGPITSWQINEKKLETIYLFIYFFYFLRLHNHLDDDCSHGIKTLAHWKKSYDKAILILLLFYYYFNLKHTYHYYGVTKSQT